VTSVPSLAVDPALVASLRAECAHVGTRATDRLSAAHDASHYVLTPLAVARAETVDEVAGIVRAARSHATPLTFRSGGTSLSGQAGTEGILVDVRRHFRSIEVLDDGLRVRAESGATLRAVNSRLARRGRKLGPDPASEIACTIGGVVANNSSGMSCGTHANAYRTVESLVLVLPSGTVIETGAPDADELLKAAEPDLHAGLLLLRERVCADPDSVRTIRRLHSLKNTMGYGLNAFLDFVEPIDILQHLVIGSEGTLAFIASATFRTVEVKPHAATALLVFPSIREATAALETLMATAPATIELLDAASLRVAQQDSDGIVDIASLAVEDHAALLVEFQERSERELSRRTDEAMALLRQSTVVGEPSFSTDPTFRARLWRVRKGLFTAVAGARPAGTTPLLEDIAVPLAALGETCQALAALFDRYAYEGSVVFGHAKDGNIHFLINERFDEEEGVRRYEAFTEDMVQLVLSKGGTLKAEHGTGRVMAPYVERQYGSELYAVMWEVKRLFDPDMTFNPGVLLTTDPRTHTKNLKVSPVVEAEVDRCVECGYCEPVCPSRDLTLTPRDRIVLRREQAAARARGDLRLAAELEQEYEYDGVQTCAVDGMCRTVCPVLINTGDLVRRLRAESQSAVTNKAWKLASKHWNGFTRLGAAGLSTAAAVPASVPTTLTKIARTVLGSDAVPLYTSDLPSGGDPRQVRTESEAVAVYFPSCTSTMFGPVGSDGVLDAFLRLCARSGVAVRTPDDIPSLCCGTPWKSKGLTDGYQEMRASVLRSVESATEGGRLPLVCDASSCTEGLHAILEGADFPVRVVDAVAFVDEHVLPRIPRGKKAASLTIHPTCSSTALGVNEALLRVARAAAENVVMPDSWSCCAFAGDRGMLHPELTAQATGAEAAEVNGADSEQHASVNRTCELGMTRATGREYRHVLQVLDDTLRGEEEL
jgi:D-lactate dehydrogenase